MKNKGFSLVELIVVIAIMAILVGVAVPVYSSYIEKAQKSKDEQMVDEIKHAIEIAAVGESWYQQLPNGGAVGTVVISKTGTTVSGDNATLIQTALEKTFGDLTSLKLSYDGWTGTLQAANASILLNSSYYGKTDILMDDVQGLANSLQSFLKNNPTAGGTAFKNWLQQNEFTTEVDGSLTIKDDKLQSAANGVILYVTQDMAELDETGRETFVARWCDPTTMGKMYTLAETLSMSTLSLISAEYARSEAIVNHMGCDQVRALFETLDLNNVSDANAVFLKMGEVLTAVGAHIKDPGESGCGCTQTKYQDYFTTKAPGDAAAYFALMDQVAASEDVIRDNLNDSELYSGDKIGSYVDTYISVAELLNSADVSDGDIVMVVTLQASGSLLVNVYPLDYSK